MKKCILILVCSFGIVFNIYAQYPIPSYNIPVFPKATFIDETVTTPLIKKMAPMGKIRIGVQTTQTHADSIANITTVYVCRLDKSIILGPFYITGNNTLYVDIDDQAWGVLVTSEYTEGVSVWTEEYASLYKFDNNRQIRPFKTSDQNITEFISNPSYYGVEEVLINKAGLPVLIILKI